MRAATGAPDSTGWLVLSAPLIVITDSSSINGSERGYKGAYMNSHPWGYGPGGGNPGGVSGGGGGGGAYGGDGGVGGDLYGGTGGTAYGDSADTLIEMGSGGGAGRLSAVDGTGGSGGSSVSLYGTAIEIDSSNILMRGQRGYDGSVEAGGGGAGGGLLVWGDTVSLHYATINAAGGNGGDASFGGGGGAGGGRIKIFYASVMDSSNLALLAQGGNAGTGTYGNPQPGMPGSIYIGLNTGIKEIVSVSHQTLMIKPNPSQGVIRMVTTSLPAYINIRDCTGRTMRTISLTSRNELIDLRDLPAGVYFLDAPIAGQIPGKLVITH